MSKTSTLKIEVEITEEERVTFINALAGTALRNEQVPASVVTNDPHSEEAPEPVVPNETGAEIDSAGVPWNADFHATTKGTNNDGTWKKKRGVDKAAAATYEAQFSAPTPVATPEPEVPTAQIPQVTPTVETPVAPAPAMPTIPMPGLPTAPAAPVEMTDVPWEQVVQKFQEVVAQFGQEYVESKMPGIYQAAGVSSDGVSLQSEPSQRVSVYQQLSALNGN